MLDIIIWFQTHWVETLCTFIISGLTCYVKYLYSKIKKEFKEQEDIKQGILAILQERLCGLCAHLLAQNRIDTNNLSILTNLYKAYHTLGGNGVGTELYERCLKLPIKEKE